MTRIYNTETGEIVEVECMFNGQDVLPDVMGGCGLFMSAMDGVDFELDAEDLAWWERWAELEERINDALDGADALTLEQHSELVDLYGYDLELLHEKEVELLGIDD